MKPRVSQSFSQPWSLKLGLDRVTNVLDPCQNQGTRQVTQKIKPCWLQLPSCRSKEKYLVTENGTGPFNLCKYSAKVTGFTLNWLYLGGGFSKKNTKPFIWSMAQQNIFSLSLFFEFCLLWKSLLVGRTSRGRILSPRLPFDSCWWPCSSQNEKHMMKEVVNISLAWFHPFLINVEITFLVSVGGIGVTTMTFWGDLPCLMLSFQSVFQSEWKWCIGVAA